ncbi:hypothetical protein GCM10027347_57550 [Larkinella harenae]
MLNNHQIDGATTHFLLEWVVPTASRICVLVQLKHCFVVSHEPIEKGSRRFKETRNEKQYGKYITGDTSKVD